MRILVTGASGFIGSYTCRNLLAKGHEVIGAMRTLNEETISLLNGASFIQLDVLNTAHLQQEVAADAIVHTATSNDILSRDTIKGIELSGIGTRNMLDFAVKNGIGKFICFSTFQVYGTELSGQIDENSPADFVNDYGLNHLLAEHYVQMYARNRKITGMVVRPSNVYGEILSGYINRWTLVPACFCLEAFEKQTITILSSGKQNRNFVSLDSVSNAVGCILENYPGNYEIFNVAGNETYDMVTVAGKVKKIYEARFGKTAEVIIKGTMPVEGNVFTVSSGKLGSTGYRQNAGINLETEIEKVFTLLINKSNHQ
jgi:nucleoside-diphosphate-sugar epimerase